MPTDAFYFEGFLPKKKGRTKRLKYLKDLDDFNDGKITNAQMDMLDPKGRDELIATGKVTYHGHKAWEAYGITQYDERYFSMVFGEIRWLLRNDPKYEPPVRNSRVVLERNSNALFGD